MSKYNHLSSHHFPRLVKGFDIPLSFSNCDGDDDGRTHGLDGAELTKEFVQVNPDGTETVITTETKTLTTNPASVQFIIPYTDTENLPTGIYKVRLFYIKDGFKQLFTCCKYILEEC